MPATQTSETSYPVLLLGTTLSFFLHCVVPENIQTPTTERISLRTPGNAEQVKLTTTKLMQSKEENKNSEF